jgi:WD40 repeat protein
MDTIYNLPEFTCTSSRCAIETGVLRYTRRSICRMVTAFLAHRFAPSSRGLKRAEKLPAKDFRAFGRRRDPTDTTQPTNDEIRSDYHQMQNDDINNGDSILKDDKHPWSNRASATGHRRKPFRAMAFLTSVAADLDVIMDWIFFHEVLKKDLGYREEYANSGSNEKKLPYLIPPVLIFITLATCIIGTVMWIILATDGRIAAPILRRLGIDKLSIGITLFLCVILEDIPQVVLTFLIEDYYEEDDLSTIAVCNVMASLYDTLIKLAEAIDERHDMVETGAWCKHSIPEAHSDTISAVVTLCSSPQNVIPNSDIKVSSTLANQKYIKSTRTLALATTQLPSLCFMTASLDGTVRLWNSNNRTDVPGYSVTDTVCSRTYKGIGNCSVTCLALLGEMKRSSDPNTIKPHMSNSNSSHFLSGYQNGTVQLWCIENCDNYVQAYQLPSCSPVTGLAVVKVGEIFAAAYQNGSAHLWHAWSGVCLARYSGHSATVRAMCAMGDGEQFVTGSDDRTLRLWNISSVSNLASPLSTPTRSRCEGDQSASCLSAPSDEVPKQSQSHSIEHEEHVANEIYQGHSEAILSVACMECGTMFVSGSMDRTARLWEVNSGACLQTFVGHSAGVSSVAAIDEVTLLTGSIDTTLKLWDALRGTCLRTYWGHTSIVTGVSVTDDDTTFVTSSVDRTINIWVLTALPADIDPHKTIDNVFDTSEGCCRGYEPE